MRRKPAGDRYLYNPRTVDYSQDFTSRRERTKGEHDQVHRVCRRFRLEHAEVERGGFVV